MIVAVTRSVCLRVLSEKDARPPQVGVDAPLWHGAVSGVLMEAGEAESWRAMLRRMVTHFESHSERRRATLRVNQPLPPCMSGRRTKSSSSTTTCGCCPSARPTWSHCGS